MGSDTVATMLRKAGYSLQANRKVIEGTKDHPDRDTSCQWIADQTAAFQGAGQPVISVDAKKKELVGAFKNGGREWHEQKHPKVANVYDFPSLADCKATPYGVYDVTRRSTRNTWRTWGPVPGEIVPFFVEIETSDPDGSSLVE